MRDEDHEPNEETVRACIEQYIENLPDGHETYPSDVAIKFSSDADAVESVMDGMYEGGLFR